MTSLTGTNPPVSDVELFTDEALQNPYQLYAQLRDLGPAVHLPAHQLYVLPRYQEVRDALANWAVFSSAQGVTMNEQLNAIPGTVIGSDPPDHTVLRKVLARPMRPDKIRELTPQIKAEAEQLVERLVARGRFDAATELAEYLPLSIVADLVGLGEIGKERMLDWGSATFDAMGPPNQHTLDALPKIGELVEFALTEAIPGKLNPDGWAAGLYAAAARGELSESQCPMMMIDYTVPSLDTTIFATSNAIMLFAQHPEQWTVLREDPSLVPHAINEVLRLESPIQRFCRHTTEDYEIDGATLPAGSRVMLLYGSANRDERKYPDPERFDVQRRPSDHVAFGYGEHLCVGMNLARLEIRSLLEALLPRVERFEITEMERTVNNTLRGLGRLEVHVH